MGCLRLSGLVTCNTAAHSEGSHKRASRRDMPVGVQQVRYTAKSTCNERTMTNSPCFFFFVWLFFSPSLRHPALNSFYSFLPSGFPWAEWVTLSSPACPLSLPESASLRELLLAPLAAIFVFSCFFLLMGYLLSAPPFSFLPHVFVFLLFASAVSQFCLCCDQ